jgi:hypothetical protein
MKGQGKIVAHHGNLVGPGGFFDQRRSAAAIGTLQVFKDYDGHLRALRRTQCGIHKGLLCRSAPRSSEYRKQQPTGKQIPGNIFHNSLGHGKL